MTILELHIQSSMSFVECDGWASSEHSEYDPVRISMTSVNQLSMYIMKSQLWDTTLQT